MAWPNISIMLQPVVFTEEEEEIFTDLQKRIIRMKNIQTYEEIISGCTEIKTPKNLNSILFHTLMGNRYEPGDRGRDSLVGDVPMKIFEKQVIFAADNNRAITIFEAITLLQEIEGNYLYKNYKLADQIGCIKIGQKILFSIEKDLSVSWLRNRIEKLGIQVKNAQSLEMARHKYCHSEVLRIFYENFIQSLPTNPDLIYNADETASSFNRRGKVIVPNGHFPIRYEGQVTGHFTSVCAFNASGNHILKPFIIIPKNRRFPDDLIAFKKQAMFAMAPNGWITNRLFLAFIVYFVHSVSEFRVRTQNFETVWLIVDGHKSRNNTLAIEYCAKHNIKILVLPAHTSHVTQPFDVGLASPMKREIRSLIERPSAHIQNEVNRAISATAKQRVKLVAAIINAWHRVATPTNCASAFDKAGIFPYNVEKVLSNKFVRATDDYAPEDEARGILLNGLEITHNLKRLEIANAYYHRRFRSVDEIPYVDTAMVMQSLNTGLERVLSEFPKLYVQVMTGIIYYV